MWLVTILFNDGRLFEESIASNEYMGIADFENSELYKTNEVRVTDEFLSCFLTLLQKSKLPPGKVNWPQNHIHESYKMSFGILTIEYKGKQNEHNVKI